MKEDIKKEIQEELEQLAPSLSKLKKEDAFEVPRNYFSELPDQILSRLDISQNKTSTENIAASPSITWMDQLIEKLNIFFQPKMAVGFGLAVVMMVSALFWMQTGTVEDDLAKLTDEDLETYIKANIEEFEEDALYSFVEDEEKSDLIEIEVDDEELDSYMDEIIDELDENELDELL